MTAADHPFDFARVGRRHGRQHHAALVADDHHAPLWWTAAHPPDHLGLAVEAALGREMDDDEMDCYAAAFRDAYDDAAHAAAEDADLVPGYLPDTHVTPMEAYL